MINLCFFCIISDLNFDETSLDASNQSAADPSQSQDAAVIHTEQQPIDEHQNSTIIDQEQASDYDSEASDDETSANFKRRKIQPKKSSVISMSAISNLQFSIRKSFFIPSCIHLMRIFSKKRQGQIKKVFSGRIWRC